MRILQPNLGYKMKQNCNRTTLIFPFLVALMLLGCGGGSTSSEESTSNLNNNSIASSPQRYYGTINNALEIPSPGILVDDAYTGNPTITIEEKPKNGTLSINIDGSFRYTPANGFTGSDSFNYSISTPQGDSNTSTVTLNIFNSTNYNPIQIVTQTDATSGLRHPGVLLSAQEIKAIGGALLSGDTLKDSYFSDMQGSTRGRWSSNNWKLSNSGLSYDLEGTSWTATMKDAGAGASRYALAWMMKRDKVSEGYAIDILNEWAKVTSFTADSSDTLRHHRLAGSWFGFLAHAAEMLIYSDTSWPKNEQEAFKKTMRDVLLPIINEDRAISFNGNWDASATFGVLAIAVLLDDKALFDKNIEYLKSGKTNARIGHYILLNGQNAETARDQTHAQMGIQFLALCAQVAWSQGIDLYEYEGHSIGKAYEYEALYNLGEDNVPFQFWPNPLHSGGSSIQTTAMIPSDDSRSPFPIYEMVYHHYKAYRNVELPHSKEILENHTRAEGAWAIGSSWSTVSYYDLNLSLEASIRDAKKVTTNDILIDTTFPNKLILLNVGLNSVEAGSEQYISQNGDVYVADYGLVSKGKRRSATDRNISNTLEDKLYLNYRDNDGDLEYTCNTTDANNGNYRVRLHFAELFESEINKRVFHIEIEGNRVASDVDIFSLVGKDSAYVVDYDLIVSDGVLNIDIRKVTGKTILQGIEVIQMP